MEKKKLLLIAVSVGVFLVIVIGLSILLFMPRNNETPTTTPAVTRVNGNGATPPQTPPPAPPAPIVQEQPVIEPVAEAPDTSETRDDLYGLQVMPSPETNGTNLVIEVPRPSGAAVPPSGRPTDKVLPDSYYQEQARATVQTQPKTTVPTAIPAVATVKPSTRVHDDYWVQAGSFSTQVRAEDVRVTLASKGITSIIENRDVNGQNFFRVRIGPYTSQNEADYWLSLVKTINGFEGSQIWLTRSER